MLYLGSFAFGGPAAHLAMLRTEVVDRRRWITGERFLDLVGASALLPGPTSTQVCMQVSMERAGAAGLWVGGLCFITPAVLITLCFAWLYVSWGATPTAAGLLYGVKPVVAAIILGAVWQLGRTAAKNVSLGIIGVLCGALYLGFGHEVLLILGAGLAGMALRLRKPPKSLSCLVGILLPAVGAAATASPGAPDAGQLFLYFLKIGSLLFGGGYVLIAFIRQGLVHQLHWLSDQQLLDAVAAGQFTPGPLFSTAAFVGYVVGGWRGGVAASAGIFLPSFILVGLTHAWVRRLRESVWAGGFLDGATVGSVGLMAGVLVQLMATSLPDVPAWALFLGAAVLVFRTRLNSVWAIAAGALIGLLAHRHP